MTAVTAEWETGEFDRFGRGYPRPQLVRDRWLSLNGTWDFAIDPEGRWTRPTDVEWSTAIKVPFAPDTATEPKIPFARLAAAIRAEHATPIPSELREQVQAHRDES